MIYVIYNNMYCVIYMHAYICTGMEAFLSCSYPQINTETSVNYKCPGNGSDLL